MAEDTNTPEGAGQTQQLPPLFNATLAKLSADREDALEYVEKYKEFHTYRIVKAQHYTHPSEN